MKQILLYYFSGTGNTWWVAMELFKSLKEQGQQVKCLSIEGIREEQLEVDVTACDHLVLGFPVHGSTAPKLMRDFILRLPQAKKNQSATVFGTHALASGDSAYHIGRQLEQKGFALRQAVHFTMMNNLHIPRFRFVPPKNDVRVEKLLQKALPKIRRLSWCILQDRSLIVGRNIPGHLLGSLQRKHIDHLVGLAARDFSIDAGRCVDCGKCIRICPVQNINRANGQYTFSDKCFLCMRCYSQCPKQAILIGEATIDASKYPRYKGPEKDFDVNILLGK